MGKRFNTEFVDDGRTVADMSADWMPWNRGIFRRRGERDGRRRKFSKEEKREQKQTYRAALHRLWHRQQ